MKNTTLLAAALAVGATGATAGGIDRSGQSIAPLFEAGNYMEFSFGVVTPHVSGNQVSDLAGTTTVPGIGQSSGNMSSSYTLPGAAYKRDLTDSLSFALIWDQPFGADVAYPAASSMPPYAYAGSTASIDSNGLTVVGRYKLSDRFSIHAGLRSVTSSGTVSLSNGYTMDTSRETDFGYLVGAAYEIPDIALRAALTYNSAITHTFAITENSSASQPMDTTLPQSINFDFQTGIAANTLLTASVRWADWTAFEIAPYGYVNAATNPRNDALVSYDNDTISYSLGIGRKFSDVLSGSATIGYEKPNGGYAGNLGPTDGYVSLALGLKYQINDTTALSGGVRYVKIGDAETENPSAFGTTFGEFKNNHAVGVGFKLSHSF